MDGVISPVLNPQLEDLLLLVIYGCLPNIFTASFHIWKVSLRLGNLMQELLLIEK
jgi:hypothetical protein